MQEQITQELRAKTRMTKNGEDSVANKPAPASSTGYVKIRSAYRLTPEQAKAGLARIFRPEELARFETFDLNQLPPLPQGAKSLSELVNEDREDRV